jgi:hypothetical protein
MRSFTRLFPRLRGGVGTLGFIESFRMALAVGRVEEMEGAMQGLPRWCRSRRLPPASSLPAGIEETEEDYQQQKH